MKNKIKGFTLSREPQLSLLCQGEQQALGLEAEGWRVEHRG